ncbi:MBL fold metallo-hydrolase [Novimethylophilus kurashikiensis]|uniref:MBL fold metallo-hydrolase n=2 Tax=Novimethylophilus kurashikiensis TaxID=1825523 RepID=A0A2R5FAK1_9PROT|nr:MBL fold metallo-hydrolase [Novimethylophilus kurashikiensis]
MSFNYVVQVFCTGMGWVDSKHGGNTPAEAKAAEERLLSTDDAWVNPAAPRQTRIKPEVSHG